jgi:hypothetical protein
LSVPHTSPAAQSPFVTHNVAAEQTGPHGEFGRPQLLSGLVLQMAGQQKFTLRGLPKNAPLLNPQT